MTNFNVNKFLVLLYALPVLLYGLLWMILPSRYGASFNEGPALILMTMLPAVIVSLILAIVFWKKQITSKLWSTVWLLIGIGWAGFMVAAIFLD
jgi:hypothetical protein